MTGDNLMYFGGNHWCVSCKERCSMIAAINSEGRYSAHCGGCCLIGPSREDPGSALLAIIDKDLEEKYPPSPYASELRRSIDRLLGVWTQLPMHTEAMTVTDIEKLAQACHDCEGLCEKSMDALYIKRGADDIPSRPKTRLADLKIPDHGIRGPPGW